jgi:hypothetical protein
MLSTSIFQWSFFKEYYSNSIIEICSQKPHTAIRDCWIQKYKPKRLVCSKTNIDEFIIEMKHKQKVGSEYIWL